MDAFTAGRYRLMRSLIAETPTAGKILVDLGAGPTPITAPFECRLPVRLDILLHTQPTVICDFLTHIPLADRSVDGVVAGEILEHVSYSRLFVGEIARVLRPGGWLVLSVPNIVSLKYRVSFLLGRIPALAAKADYTYPVDSSTNPRGHIRDYSFAEVRRVLGDQGAAGGRRAQPGHLLAWAAAGARRSAASDFFRQRNRQGCSRECRRRLKDAARW